MHRPNCNKLPLDLVICIEIAHFIIVVDKVGGLKLFLFMPISAPNANMDYHYLLLLSGSKLICCRDQ